MKVKKKKSKSEKKEKRNKQGTKTECQPRHGAFLLVGPWNARVDQPGQERWPEQRDESSYSSAHLPLAFTLIIFEDEYDPVLGAWFCHFSQMFLSIHPFFFNSYSPYVFDFSFFFYTSHFFFFSTSFYLMVITERIPPNTAIIILFFSPHSFLSTLHFRKSPYSYYYLLLLCSALMVGW